MVGPPVASPAPLGVPSVFQRTEAAVVVVVGKVAMLPVVNWLLRSGGLKRVMRGPRPPEGLLTSAICLSVRSPCPVFQATVTVTRRKSSGWFSGSRVPALAGTGACGEQTLAGGSVATLSFGSSYVQTWVVTVYSMPRREIVHGDAEPEMPALACSASTMSVGLSLS